MNYGDYQMLALMQALGGRCRHVDAALVQLARHMWTTDAGAGRPFSLRVDDDVDDRSSSSSSSTTYLGTRTLYHATNASAARSILSEGFRCGSSGCIGGGIYFAESPSSARHKSNNGTDVVLECRVDCGRAVVVAGGVRGRGPYSQSSLRGMNADSVYLPNGARGGDAAAEYVVFSSSRVDSVSYA